MYNARAPRLRLRPRVRRFLTVGAGGIVVNNVVLAAPWVSLHHGLIHFDEQHANYSDLGSTNGTTVMVKDQEMKLHPMVPMQILGAGQPRFQ